MMGGDGDRDLEHQTSKNRIWAYLMNYPVSSKKKRNGQKKCSNPVRAKIFARLVLQVLHMNNCQNLR